MEDLGTKCPFCGTNNMFWMMKMFQMAEMVRTVDDGCLWGMEILLQLRKGLCYNRIKGLILLSKFYHRIEGLIL